MPQRPLTEQIPEHLVPYIAEQDPSAYTPVDQAAWRYILRVSRSYFAETAHEKYLKGLEETGISTDRIPLISEMDEKLRRFGWRAVAVSGFIPPAAFMEFQSLGVLPIACEMRTLEHLAYTPAPDIVHEAAGHAPIIADPAYAAYLRAYGEVARKAIFSSQDLALYEAIRDLSDIKEEPGSTAEQIDAAQKRLDEVVAHFTYSSEATYLARMNWWTVEYGLVGSLDHPRIYGAGLLSSVGESYHCLGKDVARVPFTLDCVNTSYDITRPQPQLFVTPDFPALERVLEEFSETMAFRCGGAEGLAKAKMAATVTTTVLDSGIQISGVLDHFRTDSQGRVAFLKFSGPCQLGFEDRELPGQDPSRHPDGFSAPVGKLKGLGRSPGRLSGVDLDKLGFAKGGRGRFEFESGIVLEGLLEGEPLRHGGEILFMSFRDCRITWGSEVLYQPEWGPFDLACGDQVASVFGGAADRAAYTRSVGQGKIPKKIQKRALSNDGRALNELYSQVRKLREEKVVGSALEKELSRILSELDSNFPSDWLLRLEILELDQDRGLHSVFAAGAKKALEGLATESQEKRELISRGLALLGGAAS